MCVCVQVICVLVDATQCVQDEYESEHHDELAIGEPTRVKKKDTDDIDTSIALPEVTISVSNKVAHTHIISICIGVHVRICGYSPVGVNTHAHKTAPFVALLP